VNASSFFRHLVSPSSAAFFPDIPGFLSSKRLKFLESQRPPFDSVGRGKPFFERSLILTLRYSLLLPHPLSGGIFSITLSLGVGHGHMALFQIVGFPPQEQMGYISPHQDSSPPKVMQ